MTATHKDRISLKIAFYLRIQEAEEGRHHLKETSEYKAQQLAFTETYLQVLPIANVLSDFKSNGGFLMWSVISRR